MPVAFLNATQMGEFRDGQKSPDMSCPVRFVSAAKARRVRLHGLVSQHGFILRIALKALGEVIDVNCW